MLKIPLSVIISLKMGCCGDEDEDDIVKHLNSPISTETLTLPQQHHSPSFSGDLAADVISPMNSHFSALCCRDTLRVIFEKLPIPDLARASSVCRVWNSVASDKEIVTRSFKSPWNLSHVIGEPLSGSFWRDNSLSKFAISHRIVRGDTIARLAVKYSVQVRYSKRLFYCQSLQVRERERVDFNFFCFDT